MKERQYLKKSVLLCGESDGAQFKRTFTIKRRISAGASIVCYEACYKASADTVMYGVLKEFYPRDSYSVERNQSGQLVCSEKLGAEKKRFQEAERQYIEPYQTLLQAMQNVNSELATFIPAFEIYHGCDEQGNVIGTTYIWTPQPEVETFEKVCGKIHKNPKEEPEHKLVLALKAIEQLTQCVRLLHVNGLLHRDIKPANFGFSKRGDATLTETISIFDINSVCSVFHVPEESIGTEGYMEPEAKSGEANNQTDIYAIGATLFHAIIVTEETKKGDYLYRDEYFERIKDFVDSSLLIRASEANSHPRLRKMLTDILQNCLDYREDRYECCEDLLEDLEKALYYALPSEMAKKKMSGERWVLKDIEKSLDKNTEKNSTLALQYHLFENPLYYWSDAEDDSLNVLVLGFGNYGQKFLDICLQAGQMRDRKFNAVVVSADKTDKYIYLSERPELKEFFNVDGSLGRKRESYGAITFKVDSFSAEGGESNIQIVESILGELQKEMRVPRYVFVALGEDSLNLNMAGACMQAFAAMGLSASVNFVWEGKHITNSLAKELSPVYVCDDAGKHRMFAEIERMAFNTHLVWEKDLNIARPAVRANFRRQYNHDSCVANVLSLKYKLYSVGIDLDKCSFEEAARQFALIGLNERKSSAAKIRNELIWMEHRRWVAEKLCAGWRGIQNLEDCAGGITKDEKGKRHVCIVRSRPDRMLEMDFKDDVGYGKWDTATNEELDRLDELDRMSVELHRMYARKAKELKEQNLLGESALEGIRALVESNRQAIIAFQEWITCLKDIRNGDSSRVRLYKGLRDAFLRAVESLPSENKKSVKEQVKAFETMFYPVLASAEYRDYKQNDVELIDNIPFVLTYSESITMAIPYAFGDNTKVFSNIAAATVVNPAKILYLCYVEKLDELEQLKETISYMAFFIRRKQMKAKLELHISYGAKVLPHVKDLEKAFRQLTKGCVVRVETQYVADEGRLAGILAEYLRRKSKGKKIFAVEKNETRISTVLMREGVYDTLSSYRFDSVAMKFSENMKCEEFSYITKMPYITVSDMAEFGLKKTEKDNSPEFYGVYKELWEKYCDGTGVWKVLCDLMRKHSEEGDVIVTFDKRQEKSTESEYRYILPFACYATVKKIMESLVQYGIAEQGSRVMGFTSDSCEVVICDKCSNKARYDKLFSIPYAIMNRDAVTICADTQGQVTVSFDNLIVSGVRIPDSAKDEIFDLMTFFGRKGYVTNLIMNHGIMSFTYATGQIKRLLTDAGSIIKIYTYHMIKELGQFNDISGNCELAAVCSGGQVYGGALDSTNTQKKFDCILTLGFTTLFVVYRTPAGGGEQRYDGLSAWVEKYGINGKLVVIEDTDEKSHYERKECRESVGCADNIKEEVGNDIGGDEINVVVIREKDVISKIGQILAGMLEGR